MRLSKSKADKAKAALGAKFDIREFHDQVLDTGALPMAILEKKIDSWMGEWRATLVPPLNRVGYVRR